MFCELSRSLPFNPFCLSLATIYSLTLALQQYMKCILCVAEIKIVSRITKTDTWNTYVYIIIHFLKATPCIRMCNAINFISEQKWFDHTHPCTMHIQKQIDKHTHTRTRGIPKENWNKNKNEWKKFERETIQCFWNVF